MSLRIHHGYVGGFLLCWSLLAVWFGLFVVGEYNHWLASAGFLAGGGLLLHDLLWHLKHRRGRCRANDRTTRK